MSDRKYRQRGYQDDDRHRTRAPDRDRRPAPTPGAPAAARRLSSEGAKNPHLMGSREVTRCSQCAALVDEPILALSTCSRCGQALRACGQCMHFDPGARFECTQPIPKRVVSKRAANDCTYYVPRTSWERETSSSTAPSSTSSARKAFDDLFK